MACFSAWDIQNCGCSFGPVTCVTCGALGMPTDLYITDTLGTYTATWNSGISLWITSTLCSASSTSPTAKCTGASAACNSGSQSASAYYLYSIGCTSLNHVTINRYWYVQTCTSPTYQYAPCSCNPTGPQAYSSSGPVAVTCGSLSWSGTLSLVSGNLADPVGGTTSFSQ